MSRTEIDPGVARQRLAVRAAAIVAALFAVATCAGSAALAADIDNKGTAFLMMFLRNDLGGARADQVQLALTADAATSVTVEYPAGAPTFTTSVAVTPGAIATVTLPEAASTGWSLTAPQKNLVRATASGEFVAYMINRRTASSDAALALPIDTMNRTYIVQTYSPAYVGSQFGVYSNIDGTMVTITPSADLAGGQPAGVAFDILLNAGEGFHAQSASYDPASDLSGTLIEATRPVGVVNGDGCTQIPNGTSYCDHIFEVAQPVQTWGTTIPVANLPLRPEGSIYRILASEDGTTVNLDGAPIATLDRGEFIEVPVQINGSALTGGHLFVGSAPIFVTQFMTGQGYYGNSTGDPAMGNMIPSEQYLDAYTFSTVGGGQFERAFLTIIADDRDLATITLDGSPIGASAFTGIPGSGFSWAQIELVDGTHSTASTYGHGITVEGYNSADSYIYPGGALFNPINVSDENPPLCGGALVGAIFSGFADDDRPTEDTNGNLQLDPGEDLNGNGKIDVDTGIFDVSLEVGAWNVALDASFAPGDPNVSFSVATIGGITGFGTVVARDGAGNECSVPVVLGPSDEEPPLCDLVYDSGTGSFSGSASDAGTGIASISLSADAQNLSLSADFEPGAPDVSFLVSVDDLNAPAVGTLTVADGQGLTCKLNIDLPLAHPYVDHPGWGEGIALQKRAGRLYAYVAAGEAGAHVYDVTNPAAPTFVSTEVPDPGSCAPIKGYPDFYADAVKIVQAGDLPFANPLVQTDTAFFAAGACGVIGADISDPNDLVTAFVFDTPSWAEAVDVFIDPVNETIYLYVASFWGGLRIFGQTDPLGDPAEVGEIASFGVNDPSFFGPAIDLRAELRNGRILVHVLTDRGLRTVDVTDPTAPFLVGSFEFDPLLEESGEGMTIVGNRAFIALWKGGLLVLNIANPANPTEVDSVETDLAIYAVTTNAKGTRLYAAEGMFGLRTFWVNPGRLVEHVPSQIDVAGGAWAWALAERGRYLYVAYGRLTEPATGGLQIFEFTGDIACGLGFELVGLLPPILWLRARRRRRG